MHFLGLLLIIRFLKGTIILQKLIKHHPPKVEYYQCVLHRNINFSQTIIFPQYSPNMFFIHTYASCFWRTLLLQKTYSVSLVFNILELWKSTLMNVTLTLKKVKDDEQERSRVLPSLAPPTYFRERFRRWWWQRKV